MQVADTSREAYQEIKTNGKKVTGQQRVIAFLSKSNDSFTRAEIATYSGLPLSTVCGRVRELIDSGLIEEPLNGRRKCSIRGTKAKTVQLYRGQKEMFH